MTDFTPLHTLKLKQAFHDHVEFKKVVQDEDLLKTLFDVTTRGQIFVMDDTEIGSSNFVLDSKGIGADRIIKVLNSKHEELFLWRIDGVMYKKGSKCDCSLINNRVLAFVEFKSNASNNTPGQAADVYKKASEQLQTVWQDVNDRCHDVDVDILHLFSVKAVAVFNKTVPAYTALQKSIKRKFERNNLGVEFKFDNEISV